MIWTLRPISQRFILAAGLTSWLLLGSINPARAQELGRESQVLRAAPDRDGTDVLGAIGASMRLLMIEHGMRIAFQEKTRRELGGPFFTDYGRSVRWPQQWNDTDAWWVNYIGHPIHGAAAGNIWLDHSAHREAPLSWSGTYLASRGKAAAFSAFYSLQFEVGPLSEASIGNVGMRPETTGWVDHVVTPTGAFALLVGEDVLDRYVVRWIERRIDNFAARATLRILFNPSRSLANIAQNRMPWTRDDRPLRSSRP